MPRYYTKYWQEHGRLNGTVVACRIMHQRSRNEVSSMLVFGDPAAEADFTRQGALAYVNQSSPDLLYGAVWLRGFSSLSCIVQH